MKKLHANPTVPTVMIYRGLELLRSIIVQQIAIALNPFCSIVWGEKGCQIVEFENFSFGKGTSRLVNDSQIVKQ